jgi:hypothetical protein
MSAEATTQTQSNTCESDLYASDLDARLEALFKIVEKQLDEEDAKLANMKAKVIETNKMIRKVNKLNKNTEYEIRCLDRIIEKKKKNAQVSVIQF